MNEYRFEMTASVCFSVRAATDEEAEAMAVKIRDQEIDGFDAVGDIGIESAYGTEVRVYFDEDAEPELHDRIEGIEAIDEARELADATAYNADDFARDYPNGEPAPA